MPKVVLGAEQRRNSRADEQMRQFVKTIKCSMIEKELDRTSLSEKTGIDYQRLARILRCSAEARYKEILLIADALNMPTESRASLIGGGKDK